MRWQETHPGGGKEGLSCSYLMSIAVCGKVTSTYNVDADEGNEHFLTGEILCRDGNTDNGDNELADGHSDSTDEEEASATETLNSVDTGQGHEPVMECLSRPIDIKQRKRRTHSQYQWQWR